MPRLALLTLITAGSAGCATTTQSAAPQGPKSYADEEGRVLDGGVTDFLNRTETKIIECYQTVIERPEDANDSVRLQFVIAEDGSISRVVHRNSTISNGKFNVCVEGVVASERVPNAGGKPYAISREYNFRFQ